MLESLRISSGSSSLGLWMDELTVTPALSQDQHFERAEPDARGGTAWAPQPEQVNPLTNLQSSFASQVISFNTQFDGILSRALVSPPPPRERQRAAVFLASHSSKISSKHTASLSYTKAFYFLTNSIPQML